MSINPGLAAQQIALIPDTTLSSVESVTGEFRMLDGETWYRVANVDRMPTFFMSLICSEDHWMYLASNGALTCGRRDANQAIFPYYSADKILDCGHATGPKTIIRVEQSGRLLHWEPFSEQGAEFETRRTLYKNQLGNRVLFEETNLTLGLTFRYQWSSSRLYGFVRTVDLVNLEATPRKLTVLDGLQNLLPSGLDQNFQLRFSNLADAYKRSELLIRSGLGLFYLNSIPTDRAEPSEGLQATVAWQTGLESPLPLLSNRQLERFRRGGTPQPESEIRGQRQCYFAVKSFELGGRDLCTWRLVVDVGYDHSKIVQLEAMLEDEPDLARQLDRQLNENDQALWQFAAAVDGLQASADTRRTTRHLANALFNAMRGGLPIAGYKLRRADFLRYLHKRNRTLLSRQANCLNSLPVELSYEELQAIARNTGDFDLIRLAAEFLPLTFSRRHGDPTRPWNQFRIAGRDQQGEREIGFEGNWRDIFQNWEALSLSFPGFLPGMVLRFVNASTADGYNPYRVNESGYEWERPDPADPWANIGYWGDHQIVYLLKLLERLKSVWPEELQRMFGADECVYAEIPYRIAGYQQLRANPRETIAYDLEVERMLRSRRGITGTDGLLTLSSTGQLHRVCLAEKLLLTGAVKLANLVPGGGIWLNTQRPEWNDAQNALAGFGASIVTVGYLRKFFEFVDSLLDESQSPLISLSVEVAELLESLQRILADEDLAKNCCRNAHARGQLVSQLQKAAERHRQAVYAGVSGQKQCVSTQAIRQLLRRGLGILTETLELSRRPDGLFHSFNLLQFETEAIRIEHLEEMLEGQVAILESGLLKPEHAVELLTALRRSSLYRADQQSYLLYPDRKLPPFLDKNRIPINDWNVADSSPDNARTAELISHLASAELNPLIQRDRNGDYHFAGKLRNFADFRRELTSSVAVLDEADSQTEGAAGGEPDGSAGSSVKPLTAQDLRLLEDLWEHTFKHRKYAGRSSSFFAYEGLGSIYWHMVSKLAAAVARLCLEADDPESPTSRMLAAQFREIHDGIWLHKSPETYGAIPTDPYSHTPAHAGAQQPGMTGQVKEDLLTRQLELGVMCEAGQVTFRPVLLERAEFFDSPTKWSCIEPAGDAEEVQLANESLAFTICQTPVVYRLALTAPELTIEHRDGRSEKRAGNQLTRAESADLFCRTGRIRRIEFAFALPERGAFRE